MRAWLDGFDVEVGRALEAKTGYGAKVLADATNVSLASGERVIERGRTLTVLPAIEAAVSAGDVSAAHVDAATRALRQVDERVVASSRRSSTVWWVTLGRCRPTSSSGE